MSSDERVDGAQDSTTSGESDAPDSAEARELLKEAYREQARKEKEREKKEGPKRKKRAKEAPERPEVGHRDDEPQETDEGPQEWSPLVPVQPLGSKPPFFLVHAILGSVFPYHRLALALGADRPVFGLQSRGLDGADSPIETIPEMAEVYLDAVRKVQPEGPYHLGGYSMGGWIAYEMAQQLRATGQEVAVLAAIGTPAPFGGDAPGAEAWRWTVSYVEDYYELWRNSALADSQDLQDAFFGQRGGGGTSGSAHNPFGFPGSMAGGAPGGMPGGMPFGGAGGHPFGGGAWNPFTPPGADPADEAGAGAPGGFPGAPPGGFPGWPPGGFSGWPPGGGWGGAGGPGGGEQPAGAGWPKAGPAYRVAWTNAAAQMRYLAESYDGGVDVFLTPEQSALYQREPTMGWKSLCSGKIGVYHVNGNHLNLFKEPQVLELAGLLAQCLDRAGSEGADGEEG